MNDNVIEFAAFQSSVCAPLLQHVNLIVNQPWPIAGLDWCVPSERLRWIRSEHLRLSCAAVFETTLISYGQETVDSIRKELELVRTAILRAYPEREADMCREDWLTK